MARPRKGSAGQDARGRLMSIMADRLAQELAGSITVTSLIRGAGCNRSTFYYHFADASQLVEETLDAVVPVEIPLAVIDFVRRGADAAQSGSADGGKHARIAHFGAIPEGISSLLQHNTESVDLLCRILNGPNAALAQARVRQRLIEDVLPSLGIGMPADQDGARARIVFEYAVGGVLSLMAYRAETGFERPVEDYLECFIPEVPAALLRVLSRAQPSRAGHQGPS